MAWRVDAREVAEVRDDGDRDEPLHTAQRLQRLHDGREPPGWGVLEQFGLEPAEPIDLLVHRANRLLEHDLLRGGRTDNLREVPTMRVGSVRSAHIVPGRTASRRNRIGTLPPRYAFILNPHVDVGFTRCARCDTRTNLRKLPLVIHVEGFGLVLLGKTCRLCLRCDTLVAHKRELDRLLRAMVSVAEPEYVVLGTVNRQVYRRGLSGRASLDEVKNHMADFKSYWKVEVTPGGWYPKTR